MDSLNIAIIGCGTVGGGVAQIIQEMGETLVQRASKKININKIIELNPAVAMERFNLPAGLFCGGGKQISPDEANIYIKEVIASDEIDLVVETVGGVSDFVYNLCIDICKSGKHLVTANKALMAERGKAIFDAAKDNNVAIGFEAAVCGAIPIVKAIKETFTGDKIISVSGILNGTSNYILSRMQNENLEFNEVLKSAQENGFAEADPSLDVNGGDAGHKIILLIKLAFGLDVSMEELSITGIEKISKEDIDFANEIGAKIKLICYAKKINGDIYATVRPMMVKNQNFLSGVNGATNAVRLTNKYSGKHILVGQGAGSLETASSIVSDIVFNARYEEHVPCMGSEKERKFMDERHFVFPYIVVFHTADIPGTTGMITMAIGDENINIETVSHNRHSGDKAMFSVATMPCTLAQIEKAIEKIRKDRPNVLLSDPKIMPLLY